MHPEIGTNTKHLSVPFGVQPGCEYLSSRRIRLPLPDTPGRVPVPEEVILAHTTMNDTPITAEHIARWTPTDPIPS